MKSRILPNLKMFRGPHIFTASKYEYFIDISWKCRCMKIKMLLWKNFSIGRNNILRSIFTIFCALSFSHDYFCKLHVVKMEKLENRIEYFFLERMNPNYVIYSLDPPEPMIATFSDIFGVEFETLLWRVWNEIARDLDDPVFPVHSTPIRYRHKLVR